MHRFARSSKIYSYGQDRILSAFEAFRLYGWQDPRLEGLGPTDAWDLLGESMALQPLGVAVSALLIGAGPHIPGLWGTPRSIASD